MAYEDLFGSSNRRRRLSNDSHEADMEAYVQQQEALGNPYSTGAIGDQYTHTLGTRTAFDPSLVGDPSLYHETQGMTPQQFSQAGFSPWQYNSDGTMTYTGRPTQMPTWIDQGGAGDQSLFDVVKKIAPYAGIALGVGGALGGLSNFGIPSLFGEGSGGIPGLDNILKSIGGGSGGGTTSFLGPGGLDIAPWEDVLAGNYFGGPEELLEPAMDAFGNEVGGVDFLQTLSDAGEGVGDTVFDQGVQTDWSDIVPSDSPDDLGILPEDYSNIPDVPDVPSSGGGEYPPVGGSMSGQGANIPESGGIPEWAKSIAGALGLTPASLGRIIAGIAGGSSQAVQGNRTSATARGQVENANQQIDLTAPSRRRFEEMNQNPGAFARTYFPEVDYSGLLNQAADAMGKRWSMRVGNPADSPRAIRSTERDLAELAFRAKQSELNRLFNVENTEKTLQATAGGLTRANPDAPFSTINKALELGTEGKNTRDTGVGNALAVILREMFPSETVGRTTEDIIAEILRRYPGLFKEGA